MFTNLAIERGHHMAPPCNEVNIDDHYQQLIENGNDHWLPVMVQ